MHLQENTLFDLDLWRSRSHEMLPSALYFIVTYAHTEFEVTRLKGLGGEAFTKKFNIWPWHWGQGHTKCCPLPSSFVTYPATKFEVATSKGLGGDAFTRKFHIWSFDHMKCCPVPIGILGQVRYLIVSIPDLCTLTYFQYPVHHVTYSATKFDLLSLTV